MLAPGAGTLPGVKLTIPVVVLTSSDAESDVLRSYELHANSFITKPPSLVGLQQALVSLSSYWFAIVRLPPS